MRDRTNPRHPFFDYRSCAAYFVTICTHQRRCLFGAIQEGRMNLNGYGKIVAEEWERSEAMRDEALLPIREKVLKLTQLLEKSS